MHGPMNIKLSDYFTPECRSELQQGGGADRLKLKTMDTVTDRAEI